MQIVKIVWDLSNSDTFPNNVSIADLPIEVAVPDCINFHECSDWLSEEYGYEIEKLLLIENDAD